MIMAARILIDTLALLTGPMAPETCPEEGFEFRFHADDDDSSLNVIPDDDDDDQLRTCCVPANFNFHSKCILCLCKYINLNANPVGGRERGRQQQKTSCGAQIFNARGQQSGAHYAWAWPQGGGG